MSGGAMTDSVVLGFFLYRMRSRGREAPSMVSMTFWWHLERKFWGRTFLKDYRPLGM